MKEGPDIAQIGSLVGDPARSNMLTALLGGRALTATELAGAAGITAQTASSHLAKLEAGGLISQRKQGRHRYFALTDDDVGYMLEGLAGFAAAHGFNRTRTGPKDPDLRKARICYNHLAGNLGVHMFDSLVGRGSISGSGDHIELTESGRAEIAAIGIDVEGLYQLKRPVCRTCLDWSERRSHLSGTLGKALLDHFLAKGWAKRENSSRAVRFTANGEKAFLSLFPQASPRN